MDKRFLVFLSALVVALAGCTSETDGPADGTNNGNGAPGTGGDTNGTPDGNETGEGDATLADYPELAFTATESTEGDNKTYGFEGPETASAGWTRVSLSSQVMEPHQVIFLKLDEGKTSEDALAHLREFNEDPANASEAPYESFGGVGGVTFGQTGTALLDLEPGEYVLVCNVPGPMGVHSLHGMMRNFTVTEAEGEALPAPTPKYTVALRDYAFALPDENFTAGTYVVAFTNEGDEAHEAVLATLAPGKTMEDLLHFVESGGQGEPPGGMIGGVVDVLPGETHYALVTFESGTDYGFVCFFPAEGDGAPHFVHGMVAQWHVE